MKLTTSAIKQLKRYLDRGMSRRECASRLGINPSHVALWVARELPDYATTVRELRLVKTYRIRREAQVKDSGLSQTAINLLRKGRTVSEIANEMAITKGRARALLESHPSYREVREALRLYWANKKVQDKEDAKTARKKKREREIRDRQRKLTEDNRVQRDTLLRAREAIEQARHTSMAVFTKTEKLAYVEAKLKVLRQNAKHRGISFDLDISDLKMPNKCPVLGIPLDYTKSRLRKGAGSGIRSEATVSFDRIIPTKGYVAGNVLLVSWRANRIKNDGTPDEHARIARFYRKF